jgi:hypothetical protein
LGFGISLGVEVAAGGLGGEGIDIVFVVGERRGVEVEDGVV